MERKIKNRNELRCPLCGFAVWSEGIVMICPKCDIEMVFIRKEFEKT